MTAALAGPLGRKLLRDLWARKGALTSLLVIIAIGVASFVGMASVYRDLDGARERYYRDQRLADFVVDLERLPRWAADQAAADTPNLRELRGRARLGVLVDLPGQTRPVQGTALSVPVPRQPMLNDLRLRTGSWPSSPEAAEVVLIHAFAEAHGLRPGDRIQALLLDRQHDLLVVGTAQSPEFVYLIPPDGGFAPDPARFAVLYLAGDYLRKASDLDGAHNQLLGRVHDASPAALDHTLDLLARRLDPYGVTLTTPAEQTPSVRYLKDELAGLAVQSRLLPGIFLGVAALVLNVLMGRLVAQQRTIVGTLRALGYGTGAVTLHYLAYGVAVGLAGGLVGLGLGAWLQGAMVDMYRVFFALPDLATHRYPDLLAIGVLVSVGFAVLGTLRGVRRAVRLAPADAMRPPPPERGGRVLPERIPALWRRLSFRARLVLRTVFRNPFRSTVSVAASVIATALVFVALSMVDALDYLMAYEFQRVAHQDLTVVLRDPKAHQAVDEVVRLPGMAAGEAQLGVTCDLSHGAYRKRLGIIGLPPGGRLFTPLDPAGHPIPIPEHGLVLTRKLAEILHVRPGDTLRLRPLIGWRVEVTAPVAALVDSYLGLTAYADLDYLSRLLGEETVGNQVLGKQADASRTDALLEALKQRPSVVGIGERRRALDQIEATFGATMGAMIGIMVLMAGAIAFGSVLNAVLVSLDERRREVGTLRVLGYFPGQVAGLFAGESLLLNALGIALGLYAGVGLAHAIAAAYSTELYRFPAVILPATLVLSAVVMAAFVGLAQLVVYRLVRRLDWLAVLNVRE